MPDSGGSNDVAGKGNVSALRKQAEKNGMVQVVVSLRVPFVAEGRLKPEEAERQRREIARAQEGVLEKIPSLKRRMENIKRFGGIPAMALTVTASELEMLAVLPEVEAIQEDSIMGINAGEGGAAPQILK